MKTKRTWHLRCASAAAAAALMGALTVAPTTFAQGSAGSTTDGSAQTTTMMHGPANTSSDQTKSQPGDNTGYSYGPGMMMGGYGRGIMPGYGPGMMGGGYGHGPGMMGGYGPRMMWGGGYGRGMMPGYCSRMMWGY